MQADFIPVLRGRDRLTTLVATMDYTGRVREVHGQRRYGGAVRRSARGVRLFRWRVRAVLSDNAKSVVIERDAYGARRHH